MLATWRVHWTSSTCARARPDIHPSVVWAKFEAWRKAHAWQQRNSGLSHPSLTEEAFRRNLRA